VLENALTGELRGQDMRGVVSIVLGLVFIIGGLSGKLALRGTESGPALAVIGVALIGLGIFRIVKKT
jgi:hypothetical protein